VHGAARGVVGDEHRNPVDDGKGAALAAEDTPLHARAVPHEGGFVTPNGMHRLSAMRSLGAKAITALIVREPHVSIPALLEELARRRLPLARLTTHHATLEDVFVSLTGRTLRDE